METNKVTYHFSIKSPSKDEENLIDMLGPNEKACQGFLQLVFPDFDIRVITKELMDWIETELCLDVTYLIENMHELKKYVDILRGDMDAIRSKSINETICKVTRITENIYCAIRDAREVHF